MPVGAPSGKRPGCCHLVLSASALERSPVSPCACAEAALAVLRRRPGRVFRPGRGLVHRRSPAHRARPRRPGHAAAERSLAVRRTGVDRRGPAGRQVDGWPPPRAYDLSLRSGLRFIETTSRMARLHILCAFAGKQPGVAQVSSGADEKPAARPR